MTEDVVRALGFLCLGTRLKRIGERLQADTQEVIDSFDAGVVASQFPFLAALDRLGPLAVGELAEAIGVTQPGATKTTIQLVGLGFVRVEQSPEDQRRKIVGLTEKGQAVVDTAKRELWPLIDHAVADLCGGLDAPFLDQLVRIEDGLTAAPLARRVGKNLPKEGVRHDTRA
ncbi:MarR family winged helix-turn-helix transcriptional regulator [Flaviflagellibacter deserti]|jgi:DNA-binding MarR family transcriptional regulator|uniref:MarR family winged helix-turn-helix transcriptional regulator n=1 Tax=Flaviflagellibacter deserti TaxID=2267266 RepID=A0ABV9YXQ0_9HYPH